MRKKGAQSRDAEAPRCLDQAAVHAREGGRERSNRKGKAIEDGGEQQALERKGEGPPHQRFIGASKGAWRANGDQDVEAEHGRRQYHGKHDHGFEQKFQAPLRDCQPVCAARPYGAWRGLAMAILRTNGLSNPCIPSFTTSMGEVRRTQTTRRPMPYRNSLSASVRPCRMSRRE